MPTVQNKILCYNAFKKGLAELSFSLLTRELIYSNIWAFARCVSITCLLFATSILNDEYICFSCFKWRCQLCDIIIVTSNFYRWCINFFLDWWLYIKTHWGTLLPVSCRYWVRVTCYNTCIHLQRYLIQTYFRVVGVCVLYHPDLWRECVPVFVIVSCSGHLHIIVLCMLESLRSQNRHWTSLMCVLNIYSLPWVLSFKKRGPSMHFGLALKFGVKVNFKLNFKLFVQVIFKYT